MSIYADSSSMHNSYVIHIIDNICIIVRSVESIFINMVSCIYFYIIIAFAIDVLLDMIMG